MKEIIYPIRINKYMSHMDMCARREADELIANKLVTVNGKICPLGYMVKEGDEIALLGASNMKKLIYLAYNKPKGAVTHSAQNGEKDVADEFKSMGVAPIGRLDKDSEGLLILTNDGRVTEKLLSPKMEHEKEYIVSTKERIREGIPAIFAKGMEIQSFGRLKPARAEIINNTTMRIVLTEGKKHQIRIMLSELGLTTAKLKRVRIMNIELGKLYPGGARKIIGHELKQFLSLLNINSN